MKAQGVIYDGYPSLDEIRTANGWPSEERFAKGPVAIFECVQAIPCNPCEDACPFHAIHIGNPITNIPKLDFDLCTGCGNCIHACSGLAIFVINKAYSEEQATVSFPFEYLPLPAKGDVVIAAGRDGQPVCEGTVIRVLLTAKSDHTPVVTIAVPKEHADCVRTICQLPLSGGAQAFQKGAPAKLLPDDLIVCRCEEVTAGEIRRAIRELKGHSITEIKRRVRCGMGLCQGKTCSKLVSRIITEETGISADQQQPATDRAPVRPTTFGKLAGGVGDV